MPDNSPPGGVCRVCLPFSSGAGLAAKQHELFNEAHTFHCQGDDRCGPAQLATNGCGAIGPASS